MEPAWPQLPDELLNHLLSFAEPEALGRARRVSRGWREQAEDDAHWAAHCSALGISRNGSARPAARTYCSWRKTWLDSRCVECGGTYQFKVNLDGGSQTSGNWHGAKVALCEPCARKTVLLCGSSTTATMELEMLPNLMAAFAPEGHQVVWTCGRNLSNEIQADTKQMKKDRKRLR